jgi:hypothetical protein
VSLQCPREHESENGYDQTNVQEDIAEHKRALRKDKLNDQVYDDKQNANDWQQAFSMREIFRSPVQKF